MKLDDLKTKPTEIRDNLQITGPGGANAGAVKVTVDTRVVSPTSDVVHSETIDAYGNAVVSAYAKIGGLQGKTQKIEVTEAPTEAKNCYWLPWGEGKVYMGQLGLDHEYFFTYTINGCGLFIGGTANQPQVMHANLNSDRLIASAVQGNLRLGQKPTPLDIQRVSREVAKEQSITYEQFYGNLAAKLIQTDQLSGPRVEVVTPDQYLIRAQSGFGAVFGVKGIGNTWTFYGNWGAETRQIWP